MKNLMKNISILDSKFENAFYSLKNFFISLGSKEIVFTSLESYEKTKLSDFLSVKIQIKSKEIIAFCDRKSLIDFLSCVSYSNADIHVFSNSVLFRMLENSIIDIILQLNDEISLQDIDVKISERNHKKKIVKLLGINLTLKNEKLSVFFEVEFREEFLSLINYLKNHFLFEKEDSLANWSEVPMNMNLIFGETKLSIKYFNPENHHKISRGDIILIEKRPTNNLQDIWLDFETKRVLARWENTKVTILQHWESRIVFLEEGNDMQINNKKLAMNIPKKTSLNDEKSKKNEKNLENENNQKSQEQSENSNKNFSEEENFPEAGKTIHPSVANSSSRFLNKNVDNSLLNKEDDQINTNDDLNSEANLNEADSADTNLDDVGLSEVDSAGELSNKDSQANNKKAMAVPADKNPAEANFSATKKHTSSNSLSDNLGSNQKERDSYQIDDSEENIRFNEIPVNVVFEVGRVKIPFSELKNMIKGYSFDLNRDFSNPVRVVVNGKVVAHGDIVKIGENKIGVKLTEIFGADGN